MKRAIAILTAVFALQFAAVSFAAGTKADAEAMVKKCVASIKANGLEKTIEEVNSGKIYVKDDVYITIYDMNGKCVAHGSNKKLVGKDLLEMKDPDGVFYVKERIAIANKSGRGWQNYKFNNPVTKKIEPKIAYLEKAGNVIVSAGAYNDK